MRVPFGFSGLGRSGGGAATAGSRGRTGLTDAGFRGLCAGAGRCAASAGRTIGGLAGCSAATGGCVAAGGFPAGSAAGCTAGGSTGRSAGELMCRGDPSRRDRNAARPRKRTADIPKIAARSATLTMTADPGFLFFALRVEVRRGVPLPFVGCRVSRPIPPFFRRSIRISRYGQNGQRVNLSYRPSLEARPSGP